MDFLWSPPEQAGWLDKQCHSDWSQNAWRRRFFSLKGHTLFYFKSRRGAPRLSGAIPLENAKIETAGPNDFGSGNNSMGEGKYILTITIHASNVWNSRHAFYVLAAPGQEAQLSWITALWQAAIPRADMISTLHQLGALQDVVSHYSATVHNCYPVVDAAVIATAGARSRLSMLGTSVLRAARAKGDSIFGVGWAGPARKRGGGGLGEQRASLSLPPALKDPQAAALMLARNLSTTPIALAAAVSTAVPSLMPNSPPAKSVHTAAEAPAAAAAESLAETPAQGGPSIERQPAGTAVSAPAEPSAGSPYPAAFAVAAAAAAAVEEAPAPAQAEAPAPKAVAVSSPGASKIPHSHDEVESAPANTHVARASALPASRPLQSTSSAKARLLPPGVTLESLVTDLAKLDDIMASIEERQHEQQAAKPPANQPPQPKKSSLRWFENPVADAATPTQKEPGAVAFNILASLKKPAAASSPGAATAKETSTSDGSIKPATSSPAASAKGAAGSSPAASTKGAAGSSPAAPTKVGFHGHPFRF